MQKSNRKRELIKDPNGDLFDASEASRIVLVDKGVFIGRANGQFLHLIRESDATKAELIRDELVNLTLALANNVPYDVNWPE